MRRAFASAVLEAAQQDPALVVLVGDISHGILKPFAEAFPARYYNVGICEPTIVSMASGLSKVGLNPVIHTIAPFLIERSFEQLKLGLEYEGQSANVISVGSGFDYSQLGCTHHCYDDIALIRQLPSSMIYVPGTPQEFSAMFRENYAAPGIKYFRLSEQSNQTVQNPSGGTIRLSSGGDVTLVVLGTRLNASLEAVEEARGDVTCDVLYVNRVKPLDASPIRESVAKTGRLVVVEEHSTIGGLADACLQALVGTAFEFRSLGVRRFLHEYGSHEDLCLAAGLSARHISEAIKSISHQSGQSQP